MKAVQVGKAGGGLEIVNREIPEPGPGQVRIRVEACGICHSDAFIKGGMLPGVTYPRIPGHEIAGTIDAIGAGVSGWTKGARVGVVTGASLDGGYAEYTIASHHALARIPDALRPEEAAPLLCAGITTYNALRHSGAKGGDLVAVQGIGGLGHLGVQFASKLGFETVAISSGHDKEVLARKLGAAHYIDTSSGDPAQALQRLGGARVVLATAPSGKVIASVVDGLGRNGTLLIVAAAAEPIQVSSLQLLRGRRTIRGWASGHAADSEDTMRFAALTGVRPMVETFPLSRATQAFERMTSNQARFRVVLRMKE